MKTFHKGIRALYQSLHVLTLPAILIYYEILLMLLRGNSMTLTYAIVFAAGAGLFLQALLSFLPQAIEKFLRLLLIFLIAALYLTETLIRSSFQQYMTISAIISGAGGVVGHYSQNLVSAILAGLPIAACYLLPFLLCLLDLRFGKAKKRAGFLHRCVQLLVGLLIFSGGILTVTQGSSAALYRENYNFNVATAKFGLLTSMRLETQYALLGNHAASEFSFDTGTAAAPTKSEPAAPESPADQQPAPSAPAETASAIDETSLVAEPVASASEASIVEEPVREPEYNVSNLDFEALLASSQDDMITGLHTYVSSQTPSLKNDYTGAFAGKNLILICAEALSDHAVIPELTPTLARILNNGFVFSDYYQPSWGGSTSTGEYSFLLGLIPCHYDESMLMTRDDHLYYTMGNSMQRLGYTTYAFHSGYYTYYNRNLTHENLGYSSFIATGQGMEEITGQSYSPDTECFDATLDLYLDQQPFSVYYMSISGHSNYRSDSPLVAKYYDIVDAYVGNSYKETTKYYFCYQMELDRALEQLINRLTEAGIADDTVIALTPDHYPYGLEYSSTFGNTDDYMADLYGYAYTNWWNLDTSVLAIWSTCMEKDPQEAGYVAPCRVDSVSYSIDVLPTLLNLFGIDFDSRLLAGRDLLAPDTEPIVIWENYSWLTDLIYHDADSGNNYLTDGSDALAGDEYQDYIDQHNNIARNKILYSDRAIQYDYFRILFGDDQNF